LSTRLHPLAEYERFTKEVQHWNIMDTPKYAVRERVRKNLQFIRLILTAFPNQDDPRCSSLRSFTADTNLIYTVDSNDSVLNVVRKQHTYRLVDDFTETAIDSVNVNVLAQTYSATMGTLPVKDIDTLVHYLLNGYENNGDHASVLGHLSENTDRVALLKHTLQDHVATSCGNETDEEIVSKVCQKYRSNFVIPYTTNTACLAKLGRVQMSRPSDLLATHSVLSRVIANRMFEGTDLGNSNVNIQELARALGPRRLYKVVHRGETFDRGRHVPIVNAPSAHKGWREKLLVQLKSKAWSVCISEIIQLHTNGYSPEDKQSQDGMPESAFFLSHEDDSLVVWHVLGSPPVNFPDNSPHILEIGNVAFTKGPPPCIKPASPTPTETEEVATDMFNEQTDGHSNDNIESGGSPVQDTDTYNMHDLVAAVENIEEGAFSPPQNYTSSQIHDLSVHSDLSATGRMVETTPSQFRNRLDTVQSREPLFVAYRAIINPWDMLKRQDYYAGNPINYLMQARVELSDSNSEDSD
jgi:hypothetical protein